MTVKTVSYYVTDMFSGETQIGKTRVPEKGSSVEEVAIETIAKILYNTFQDKDKYSRYNIRYNSQDGWLEAKYIDAKGERHHGRYDNFLVVRSL